MQVAEESSEGPASARDSAFLPSGANVVDFGITRWKGNDDSAICVSSKQLTLTSPIPPGSQDPSCDTEFELSIAPDDKQSTTAKVYGSLNAREPYFPGLLLDPETPFNTDEGEEDELNLASAYEHDTVPRWDHI